MTLELSTASFEAVFLGNVTIPITGKRHCKRKAYSAIR